MTSKEKTEPVILLAEDSDDDAFFFQRAFLKVKAGCALVRAENGKVALETLRARLDRSEPMPLLFFLDLKMPVMSGFEVLEGLRIFDSVPKVIVLSGSNDQNDRSRALSLGAADYLVKPITTDVLRERIFNQLSVLPPAQRQTKVNA